MNIPSISIRRLAGGILAALTIAGMSSLAHAETLLNGLWKFNGKEVSTTILTTNVETLRTFKGTCEIDQTVPVPPGEADLVTFTSREPDSPPSYAGNGQAQSIGIFAGGKNCGYIQSLDQLTMALGTAFPQKNPDGSGGTIAGKALFELELKQDAISTIELGGRIYTVTSGNSACPDGESNTGNPRHPAKNEIIANGCISDSSRDSADVWPVRLPLPTVRNTDGYGLCGGFDDPAEPGGELVPQPDCVWEAGTPLEPEVGTTAADINGDLPDDADNDGDADYLGPSLFCSPSNCHDDDVLEWGESDTEAATIETSEGKTGIKGWTIDVGVLPQGELSCDPGKDLTAITRFSFGDSGGTMQCRRQPNVNGAVCSPFDYLISGSCDSTGDCEASFLHGDEKVAAPTPRAFTATVCEVYWPERVADTTTDLLVPKTRTFWGPGSLAGDTDLWYCPGVTPVFNDAGDPGGCGDGVEYLLSNDGDNTDAGETSADDPWANGGDVNPVNLGDPNIEPSCSLLLAIDNVLTPEGIDDQCDTAGVCNLDGIQAACLLDRRTPVVQDSAATRDCTNYGGGEECSISNDAETRVRTYELLYQRGDFDMKSFSNFR